MNNKIYIKIKPNSKKGPLVEKLTADSFVVYVREPAVDGRANAALIRILADYLYTSPSRLSIVRGHTSRDKVIEIS